LNATFAQVNSGIYSILDLLDGSDKPLQTIYDHPPGNLTGGGFPAAFPVVVGAQESILENVSNSIAMNFIVRVLMRDKNTKTSYDAMLSVLDAVLAELRRDDHWTLGGIVEHFRVSPEVRIFRTGEGDTALIGFDIGVTAESVMSTLQ